LGENGVWAQSFVGHINPLPKTIVMESDKRFLRLSALLDTLGLTKRLALSLCSNWLRGTIAAGYET